MQRPFSSTTLVILVATYAVPTLATPTPGPARARVQWEEDPPTAESYSNGYETSVESQEIPHNSMTDNASSMAHPVRAELRNVDSASHQPSAAPFTPLGILARDAVDDGCRSALGMLERDYTGHGLPLTSLVIESSTLLLLVVFVVYFVVGRCRVRREHLRLFTPTPTLSQPSTASRDSIAKTITLTPPPPLLSKIDEDSHSSGPTHPSHIQLSPPSPPQTPLSPQRGPPPASPSRAIFRSPSCTNVSTATARSGLEKKASFLSLKG